MKKPIINIDELNYAPFPAPMPEQVKEKYEGSQLAFVAPLIGAQKLGYNVTIVPPGKRAFPFHSHHVNEEMFFILEGEGEVRIGTEIFSIKKGDFIAHPALGPAAEDKVRGVETAHQIVNTSKADLKYLAVSTKLSPEIAYYPDSRKFGVLTEDFRFLGKEENSLGYWDGE